MLLWIEDNASIESVAAALEVPVASVYSGNWGYTPPHILAKRRRKFSKGLLPTPVPPQAGFHWFKVRCEDGTWLTLNSCMTGV